MICLRHTVGVVTHITTTQASSIINIRIVAMGLAIGTGIALHLPILGIVHRRRIWITVRHRIWVWYARITHSRRASHGVTIAISVRKRWIAVLLLLLLMLLLRQLLTMTGVTIRFFWIVTSC